MNEPDLKIEQMLHEMLAAPCIRDLFGIELLRWQPGAVTLCLDHRPELGHATGWFQGAVTTAIAEYAAGLSAISLAPDKAGMTVQQSIHFTGPAHGDRLIAAGRVLAATRTISTAAADVLIQPDGEQHKCATLTMTKQQQDRK